MNIILAPFSWLLLVFYNLVGNYGIALIIFALVVKLILFPVALKGKRGMIQMNMLSGKMQKLQKQYGADKERYNMEVQKLYEREKVSPMGGCLWTMIPLLILLPLYSIIRQPLQYLMNLTPDQITAVAEALNWAQVSIDMGWVKDLADGAINAYTTGAYNELFLASLINEGNLQAVQAAVGEGTKVFAMNFAFMGLDLSQIPTWQIWTDMTWNNIGLFLMVIISAGSGLIFSRVSMKTNSMNQQAQTGQMAQTNKMMMWMSPLMSLWIGFIMPGLLCLYWIANNVLSMGQEFICSKMLKKDYEKAAALQAENEAREKEDEKRRKRELAERRALEAEEAKKNKKAAKKTDEDKKDLSVAEVSRVGLRNYARGRAYDPNRFDGVTEYRNPDDAVTVPTTPEPKTSKSKKKEQAAIAAALEEPIQTGDQLVVEPVIETVEPAQEVEVMEEMEAVEDTDAVETDELTDEAPEDEADQPAEDDDRNNQ